MPPAMIFYHDQIFSQFIKITFNNTVKKNCEILQFFKILQKKSQTFLGKCTRETLLI